MSPPSTQTLDDIVAAFEAALARNVPVDLTDFLPPSDAPLHQHAVAELVRVELEHDWEKGKPRPIALYFDRFPEVFADTSLRHGVAYEEYRLRRQAGQMPDPGVYASLYKVDTRDWPACEPDLASVARSYRSFRMSRSADSIDLGSWLGSVPGAGPMARVFCDLHRTDPHAADRLAEGLSRLPKPGENFLGFRLLEELGRGAFGRVYLARQEALARRLVALKVTPDAGGESQALAQLQHTHIVPVYSVHRSELLQAVCMPYFGSVTLSDVLRDVSTRPVLPRAGSDLLTRLTMHPPRRPTQVALPLDPGELDTPPEGIDLPEATVPHATVPQATLRRLEGLSYVEAVVWLGCCLADGLAHAHERGILHRDLKPANILLTDDGQPMLLDFNLAEDVKLRDSATGALVGGTIPYMAPEQLAAFRGESVVVDGRADLFSLGMILYELLAGQSPFPPPGPTGEDVDARVEAVLHSRRVQPIPVSHWNQSVSPAVWSILRRCLAPDAARRYASARHLQEDLQRQLDHEPLRHAPEPFRERFRKRLRRSPKLVYRWAAGVCLVLLMIAAILGFRAQREKEVLDRVGKARDQFSTTFTEGYQALFTLSIDEGPARRREGVHQARAIVDRYQLLEPEWRSGPLFRFLDESEKEKLVDLLGDLLIVLARAVPADEALPMLDRAEDLFGHDVPPALWVQRAGVLEQLGDSEEGQRLREKAKAKRPVLARDYYLRARDLLVQRRFGAARPILERATFVDPQSVTARLLLGVCYDHLDLHADAANCYDVCLALAPNFHGGFFNRALAYQRMGKLQQAIADYDRAIRLMPESADGYANRGLCRFELGKEKNDTTLLKAAVEDFSRVLEIDPGQTRALLHRSWAKTLVKDRAGAEADLQEARTRDAGDDRSWNTRGGLHLERNEVQEALRCFDSGLALHPRSFSNLTSKAYVLAELLGRPQEALAICNNVVEWFPDYIYAFCNRGIMLARLGRLEEAARDAQAALGRSSGAEMKYRVACIYALTSVKYRGDADFAVRLLHDALVGGFGARELPDDPDLKPLHTHPDFPRLRDLARSLTRQPGRDRR